MDNNELREEKMLFSYGIHPKNVLENDFREDILLHPDCVAVGEAGLDKLIDVPMEAQIAAFEMQVLLSEKHRLPLILHCVKAWNEVVQVRRKLRPEQRWIFHGFRKTALLESVLAEGLMVSIGTAVLYDRKLQQTVAEIPDNRLFLETDSDAEHGIEEVYEKVAALKVIPVEALAQKIEQNLLELLRRHKTKGHKI